MPEAKSVVELKKAVNKAKHISVWSVLGVTQEGTQIGSYLHAYKAHVLAALNQYKLPTASWDKSVRCYFRYDEEADHLYIEGFHAVAA